jgi:rubrerythrin
MPNFANPFQGNVDRKLSNAELMQALRLDIAGELEAISCTTPTIWPPTTP